MKTLQAVRGMNDVLPEDSALWQYFERTVADLLTTYGYQQVRMPIVEPTELFKRSIGEVTDIVEKEMYTFEDRNGDSLTLRPEGTAGCVRAMLQHGLLGGGVAQKVWYNGLVMVRLRAPLARSAAAGRADAARARAGVRRQLALLPHLVGGRRRGVDRRCAEPPPTPPPLAPLARQPSARPRG